MTTHSTKYIAGAVAGAALLLPLIISAQVQVNTNTTVQAQTGGTRVRATVVASTTAETTRAARAKEKATQEIDRRIAALQALLTRIEAMEKVTDTFKSNLRANTQTQIDGLNALRAKIEADTDVATLRTDVQSVTSSHRVFVLIMPQARITAAADRMATIINMMTSVGMKLRARIIEAKNTGKDTAALEAELLSLGNHLDSASAHAQAAVNLSAPLVPDQGDATVMGTNTTALKNANNEIKAGRADLVEARKDITTILQGLRAIEAGGSSTSSVQAS